MKNSIALKRISVISIFVTILSAVLLLSGCASNKLVDQDQKIQDSVIDAAENAQAEEGWSETGYTVTKYDRSNDILNVEFSYNVEGDPVSLLKDNSAVKVKNDAIYESARDINTIVTVTLSNYNVKDNTVQTNVVSTEWYVGSQPLDEWVEEQNAK